jgi:hypothetical protein
MAKQFQGIERTAAIPRIGPGMSRFAEEFHSDVIDGCGSDEADCRDRSGVPGEAGIEIVEQSVSRHEDLGASRFLRSTAVDADKTTDAFLLHDRFQRDRRTGTCGAEEIVTTGVTTRCAIRGRGLCRHGGVAESWQGVILRQEADAGAACPVLPLGDERDLLAAGATAGDCESGGFQFPHMNLRGSDLFERKLGEIPDLGTNAFNRRRCRCNSWIHATVWVSAHLHPP